MASRDELGAVSALLEELKHENVGTRAQATTQLKRIATALGPERTRDELIPFLAESVDDEDEVIMVIARELGGMVPHVGGPEHCAVLLEPLHRLAVVDDSSVREQAVQSITYVASLMPGEQFSAQWFPILVKLKANDQYMARVSLCALCGVGYQHLQMVQRAEIRELFVGLCKDNTPMVRRAAAKALRTFAGSVEPEFIGSTVLPLFVQLARDDQDSVRLQCVENCVALARLLGPLDATTAAVPTRDDSKMDDDETAADESAPPCARLYQVSLSMTKDRSWRTRWSMAGALDQLDPEPEVRVSAAAASAKVCALVSTELVIAGAIPRVRDLIGDASDHVRISVSSAINSLAPVLGKDYTVDHLLPMVLTLLRDVNSEVRLNIISQLGDINGVIGVELLSQSLLPTILELANDQKWRVRLAIINYMPMLADQLGVVFFNDKLSELCIAWLADDVHAIRMAAAENLQRLSQQLGDEWIQSFVLPRLTEMRQSEGHVRRHMALVGLKVVASVASERIANDLFLPAIVEMSSDKVANIRVTAAKSLGDLVTRATPEAKKQRIGPCLTALMSDADRDVRYFASQSSKLLA